MAKPDNGANYYKYEVYSQDIPTDKLYVPQSFDKAAWLEQLLREREGTEASNGDKRNFKRYMESPEGQAALEAAKQAHFVSEAKKQVGSTKVSKTTNPIYIPTIELEVITKSDFKNKFPKKSTWKATNADIAKGATSYTVQQGNTLGQIVLDYNKKNGTSLTLQDVAKWSGIENPSKISIGHVINFSDPSQQQGAQQADQQDVQLVAQLDSAQQDAQLTAQLALIERNLLKDFFNNYNYKYPIDRNSIGGRQRLLLLGNPFYKQGGTMNRINYFQQGGDLNPQNIQQQIIALVQTAMDKQNPDSAKAAETINQIMKAAKAGDKLAIQIAQMIQAVIQQMQGQATSAKWGSKLNYIRSLKYANGGKACPTCQAGAPIKPVKKVEEKACGGKAKKAKKRYFGGWL